MGFEFVEAALELRGVVEVVNPFVVVHRRLRGLPVLLDDEEYRKAAQTAMDYDDWIHDFHDAAEVARRLDELEAQQEREDGGL